MNTVINKTYEITEKIGAGGQSDVFKAVSEHHLSAT